MYAWSINIFLLLHSVLMLCVVKMPLKREVGGCALNIYENYIVDNGKAWKIMESFFFYFLWEPWSKIKKCIFFFVKESPKH